MPRPVTYVTDYVPYQNEQGDLDYAEVCDLERCEEHGLERIARRRTISTGYDTCSVRVFACGEVVKDDVF